MPEFKDVFKGLFKLQALINRYHANKYETDLRKDLKRYEELKSKISQETQTKLKEEASTMSDTPSS